MRAAAVALCSGILALVASLLVGRAAAGAEPGAGGAIPPGLAEALARREYEAGANARGLQAPNRAHGLRTYFEPRGIRVHDRTAPGSPELLSLTLSGVGRGEALASVAPGDVTHAGARVEIRRPGLVEWYVNAPEGLEQGFTLAKQPAGEGPLVLELALRGATASGQGDGLVFETGSGRRLSYAKLVVSDAAQRPVAARLTAPSPDRVQIVVEDAGATYPLVVDPLLTETADTQLESNQASALLGNGVASAGDVNGDGYADVIVGAPNYDAGQTDEGAAFVFLGGPSGIPSAGVGAAAAQLESDQSNSGFGSNVAAAGDVNGDGFGDVIVGACEYNAGQSLEGAAFVYLGSASGIANGHAANAQARIESDQADAHLCEVSSAGDVNGDGYADVIAGSFTYDSRGAAFVFLGSASGIGDGHAASAHVRVDPAQGGANLGAVRAAGDVNGDGYDDVIVGASLYDAGENNEGAAFVFHGSASGIPNGNVASAAARLESDQADANLGGSVAGAGDVNGDGYADVIVGAPSYDAGQTDEGAAFVFLGSASGVGNTHAASAHARLESNQAGSAFGTDVASAGDVNGDGYADVVVGTQAYNSGLGTGQGAAFVFRGSATGIANGNPATAAARLVGGQALALLGASVASAGDVNGDGYADVIAGAYGYDNPENGEGAAFIYLGGAQGILDGNPATAPARLETNQANAAANPFTTFYFDGLDAAGAGDVNGDGYADVIIGAPYYDAGQTDEGAAFLFLGSPTGIANGNPTTAAARFESDQAGAQLGRSVAGAGDVNGDGLADVIVGAWQYDAGQTDEGAAFIFLGSISITNGNPTTAAAQLESDQASAQLGETVAGAGDTNGDGYADVIVSARYYDAGQSDEGAAFVFLGGASGIADGSPATAAAQLESDQADATLGFGTGAGDVNGDGYADVMVGAVTYDAGQSDEGAAFVFLGGSTGIADGNPGTAAAQLESNQASANFGTGGGAGDVNGDGYADVIVGAATYAAGQSSEGAAFVFLGSAAGIADGNPATADAQLESNQSSGLLGFRATGAGDVNGDGYADVIVGAIGYSAGQTAEGAAFVFLGSAAGIADGNPATADAQLESNQLPGADAVSLGWSVAAAGDVNGDGFADVIVGSPYYDSGETDEGVAFVFYGGGNRTGRPVLARQLRGGGSTIPVQPWGASYDVDDFQVRMTATHPGGRGRVKLQVEACPRGSPFQSMACVGAQGTWTDVTASPAGVTLTQTVAFSPVDKLYHWRARVLYAPFGVTQPGITSPPSPAHGPWRRLSGQAFEADVRVRLDTDGDGISDGEDPDDDNDGLSDAAELLLGTDPLDEDTDGDLVCDGGAQVGACTAIGPDNCPFISNFAQQNGDAYAAGDACQCGDVTGEGTLTATDYQRAREHVAGRTPGGPFDVDRCDVTGDGDCGVEDLAVLDRLSSGAPATLVDACAAYAGP